jgi:hypothetical protein
MAFDTDCKNTTAAAITWTDLGGEIYQLERSLNAVTWSIIYTGTATGLDDAGLSNTDQMYYYRVKVVGSDFYSNISSFQIYEQDKFIRDVGCYPDFNVSPYYFRKAYRQNCGERYVDTVDEATCKESCTTITSATVSWSYACAGAPCDNATQGAVNTVAFVSGAAPPGTQVGTTITVGATDNVNPGNCFPGGCSFNYTRTYGGYTFNITGFDRLRVAENMTWTINSITVTGCS